MKNVLRFRSHTVNTEKYKPSFFALSRRIGLGFIFFTNFTVRHTLDSYLYRGPLSVWKKATALPVLAQIKNQQISCFEEEMILHLIIRIYPWGVKRLKIN